MHYLLSILLIFSTTGKKHDLSLKLQVGETYTQRTSSDINIVQTVLGTEQVIKSKVSGTMVYKILESNKEGYFIECSYISLGMEFNTPNETISFSSEGEQDPNDVFSKMLGVFIGKKFNLTMNRNGTISNVDKLDQIFDSIGEAFPELTDEQVAEMTAQLNKSYGKDALKGNIEMAMAIFPDKKVRVNESWSNTINLETGMSRTLSNTFSLAEVTDDYILIKGTSKMGTSNKAAYHKVNGMDTQYNLSGNVSSNIKIDPKTNWITEAQIEQDISGNVEILDNPNLPGGITIPMTLQLKMLVTN